MRKKVLCVVGTRPEAIKMAPVILDLNKHQTVDCKVLATAQHREMLDQVLDVFNIKPDFDLDIMQPNQKLATLTARLLEKMDILLDEESPDAVLAQGDTTTVMTVALACFYHRIPFGHVEAGLRTGDINNPFPEEMNRIVAGKLAKWHFAPTQSSKDNLLKERVLEKEINITGNTVIDALYQVKNKEVELPVELDSNKRLILVTAHRRENFGAPFREICRALVSLVEANPDIEVLYPVHPNPNIKDVAEELLGGNEQIKLCAPLDYLPFVAAMKKAFFILSDSGGVQEEAPALGKPVLVLRHETERPEAVEAGVVKLVGTDFHAIVNNAQKLLDDENFYRSMARGVSPYGDGYAATRITEQLVNYFSACG